MTYDCAFDVWPSETWGFPMELFDTFQLLNVRIKLEFTQIEFENYCSRMNHIGFSLRGVVRTPHSNPEVIL